jgi:hypothetical protein
MAGEDLLAIYQIQQQEIQRELSLPIIACPNDGTQLVEGRNGVKRCPFDGWEYPRDFDPHQHLGM